MIGTP